MLLLRSRTLLARRQICFDSEISLSNLSRPRQIGKFTCDCSCWVTTVLPSLGRLALNVRHMRRTVVEGKDFLFTWWYPGHRYLHIHCRLNSRLLAFTLSNTHKESKRILQLPFPLLLDLVLTILRLMSTDSAITKQHEASRDRRHRVSDRLRTCHTIRTAHWFSMLEVSLPGGMLHGHDLHTQYVPSLYSCT